MVFSTCARIAEGLAAHVPWHARSSSRLLLAPLKHHCLSDEHEHRTGYFRTAALAALVVRNGFHCRRSVACHVCPMCARPGIFAAGSLCRHGGPTTRRFRSRGCCRALNRGVRLAVRLQSAGHVSALSLLPQGARGTVPAWHSLWSLHSKRIVGALGSPNSTPAAC